MDGREGVYGHETFRQGFDIVTQRTGLAMRNMKNVGGGSSVGPLKPLPASIGIWEGGHFPKKIGLQGRNSYRTTKYC